jgi:hypothetical protein
MNRRDAIKLANSPEAMKKRRATIRRLVDAGEWAGPNSLRDPEIERLVRDGVPCGQCGNTFHPDRITAHRMARGAKSVVFCSRKCSAARKAALTEGVPRDVESGFGKTEHNINAHFYCVKSPDNVSYVFRNANHFVREHPNLFTEKQRTLSRNGTVYPAACGLRSLFLEKIDYRSGLKYTPSEWRGWTGVWKKDRLGNIVWSRGE